VVVIAAVALGVKAASGKKRVSGKRPDSLPHRQKTADVDDELARLKREMGS
jgi:hypothetical protein